MKTPPQIPPPKPSLPSVQKKGRGKIWGGLILIIIGIISIIVLWRMSFLPFIGGLLVLLGVYSLYKGLTDVDKVLVPETQKIGGKIKTKMVYKKKKELNKGAIFLFVMFIFFALPILLTIFQVGNYSGQPYSVFNTGDGGCSDFKNALESDGYETAALISSYAEISRFPADFPLNHTLLLMIGPKALFFPTGLEYVQQLLAADGLLVILQDEGTANEGLMFLGFFSAISAALGGEMYANPLDLPFQDGYLCTTVSGSVTPALTLSISLGGPSYTVRFWTVCPLKGTTTLFTTVDYTPDTIWLDLNKNLVQDPEDTTTPGGYAVTAVSMTNKIFLISDPDILTNKLVREPAYDNLAFGRAIIDALTGGDTTWKIVFDEIHQVKVGWSSSFYFGLIVGLADFVLLSWLFAPLGPYLAFKLVKKFIPEAEKPERLKLSAVKREGESLYGKRLDWFKRQHRFEKALTLLYRRLKRSLTKILDLRGFNVEDAIDRLLMNYPEGEINEKRLVEAFKTFEAIEKGRQVYYQDEFLKIFLEMRWVADLGAQK